MNYSAFVWELVEISGRFGDTRPHLVDYCPTSHATTLIPAHLPLSYRGPFSSSIPRHTTHQLFCALTSLCFLYFPFYRLAFLFHTLADPVSSPSIPRHATHQLCFALLPPSTLHTFLSFFLSSSFIHWATLSPLPFPAMLLTSSILLSYLSSPFRLSPLTMPVIHPALLPCPDTLFSPSISCSHSHPSFFPSPVFIFLSPFSFSFSRVLCFPPSVIYYGSHST